MKPVPRCETCKYYSNVQDCRRFPPQLIQSATWRGENSTFPHVEHNDWCGEWQAKPKPEDAE
jgi:hypothetical protein